MRLQNAIPASLLCGFLVVMANAHAAPGRLSVAQIIQKNAEARGGLKAWRAVTAISMSGKMDAGRARPVEPEPMTYRGKSKEEIREAILAKARRDQDAGEVVQLPFVMEQQRPRKVRIELQFQGQTAVQVYDGVHGWKLRPFLGRTDVDSFSPDEMRAAEQQQDLDGPLIDYAAKGTRVALAGTDTVEGRKAYKLKLTFKNGAVRHVWVDAKTFLDVKIDGSRRLDGKLHPVATYFRDYRTVHGLKIPCLLETSVEGVKDTEKIVIEHVELNPNLDSALFKMPHV